MSHCFNPACQSPLNPGDVEICQSCGSKLLLTAQSQENPAPQYRAIQLLGQGGFGRTFLAVDENKPSSFSRCVIKQFFPQSPSVKASELFRQEASRLEVLGKHPQIPELFAAFEQEGRQYLVQEFIDGKNLGQHLETKGAFTEPKIRELLNDLLPVLQFVHAHKVIHRDIKPENIITRRSLPPQYQETGFVAMSGEGENFPGVKLGQGVLVDFGAAKLVTHRGLPQTGTMIGTAAYTAPEQLMGKAVFASDLYSLGVTCIHLLTNVPPFDLFDSQEGTWVWRDYLKRPVSEDLGKILDRMLQGATNRRYSAAAAILRHLQPKPVYLEASPAPISSGLGVQETQPQIIPTEAETWPVVQPPLQKSRVDEIQQALQDALEPYHVKIQVNQAKHKLTVVINRTSEHKIHYPHLAQIITTKLTDLQLKQVGIVKLLGRLNNSHSPEWQQTLKIDPKVQFRNKLIRLGKHQQIQIFWQQVTQPTFWLATLKNRAVVIDALMIAFILFIFGSKIIVLHPWFAMVIASSFMGVKNGIAKNKLSESQKLFGTLAVIFVGTGLFIERSISVSGVFGILLSCLFVSLPLFYVKDNSW